MITRKGGRFILRYLSKKRVIFKSDVSTWTPLGSAFNTRPAPIYNLSMSAKTGLFDVPELTSHEGFYTIRDDCIRRADSLIEEAVSPNRSRKMVEIFDELSDNLCKVADLAEFIRLAHPSSAYTTAAEDACAAVSGVVEKLNTHRDLYDALKRVVQNGDIVPTNEVDNHVKQLLLLDFEQSGIHLNEQERNKVVTLNDVILQLGHNFIAGTTKTRIISKQQLPPFMQNVFPSEGDNVLVSGLIADSANHVARELAFRIYLQGEQQQEDLLMELLKARHLLAVTCGFEKYSDKALKGSMMGTPETVMNFLNHFSKNLKSRAESDFMIMGEIKKSEAPQLGPLAAWDVPYYTHRYKSEMLNVAPSDYAPYFSLGSCMEGLNILFTHLYGISFEIQDMTRGESWSSDVYKLAVVHEMEGLLGYIYCDFYERSGKPNQDCHFTIRGGRNLPDGTYQMPIVVIMLNLPVPRWSRPTLLTPSMMDNLFHEMGHAMHSMLGRTQYQHVTGTRCSTDFAEVPSVLMEYFARDPRVIRTFARHFQTKEEIPSHLLQKLCVSKNIFMAGEMQTQLFYSVLDQKYHSKHPLAGTTTDVIAEVQGEYSSLRYIENTSWQLRFSHLVGYGAKYYSYLVSTALASWIWQTYFEADPLSRTQGERYRRECLAHGGGKPSAALVADFLQKQPTPAHLSDALINEIDRKCEQLKQIC